MLVYDFISNFMDQMERCMTIINTFHPEILIYFFNSILNISATFHISVGALKY